MLIRLLCCCLLPLQMIAQNLSGIWKGTLTSEEGIVQYELAITGQDGILSGYALTKFTFAGIENIGIKKITLKKKKLDFFLEDGELVYDNYSIKPRRVMLSGRLLYQQAGNDQLLVGEFSTRSLDMRAPNQNNLTGIIRLQKESDIEKLAIIEQLKTLNLLATINSPIPVAENETSGSAVSAMAIIADDEIPALPGALLPPHQKETRVAPLPLHTAPVFKTGFIAFRPVHIKLQPLLFARAQPVETTKPPLAAIDDRVATQHKAQPEKDEKGHPLPEKNLREEAVSPPGPLLNPVNFADRKTEIIRSIHFTGDSLIIRLYDNGEIDGDTVSVLLNGRVIINQQGLTTTPLTYVIYTTAELGDTLQLVMYAENLGSIPPNTGLLTIQDGELRHSINFAGDFQKNAAVILRRRKL
jgi:hypothetical protein